MAAPAPNKTLKVTIQMRTSHAGRLKFFTPKRFFLATPIEGVVILTSSFSIRMLKTYESAFFLQLCRE
jgi:hypothetical protein